MGFLWFGSNKKKKNKRDNNIIVDDVLLQALLNGEEITRDTAMALPVVNACVDFITSAIACMPLKLYRRIDEKTEELPKDTRVTMMNGDTKDTLDGYQLKKAMVEDYLLGKGGYCFIRKKRNTVTGLFYVQDKYITIMKVYQPIYKYFQIFVGGYADGEKKTFGTFNPWDFIKLLRNTKDGASGIGLTEQLSKQIETSFETLLFQLNLVKTKGGKKGFLKSVKKLGAEEIEALKEGWRKLYSEGTENVVVLNNGVEFQEASTSATESQINESKQTAADEIRALFHIYNTDWERTFKEAIYPIVKAFETALNRDLLLEREKETHFFEFDVKEILRASLKERYEAYKLAKETGFMTLNEIRQRENMEFVEGLDVINVGLGAVLYDINRHIYYTPNTGTIGDLENQIEPTEPTEGLENKEKKMIIGHELAKEFDESGNSSV